MSHETEQNTAQAENMEKLRKKLIFEIATAQFTLEYIMTLSLMIVGAIMVWGTGVLQLPFQYIVWMAISGFGLIAIGGVVRAFKNISKNGEEGQFEAKMAELKQPNPYKFHQFSDHLFYLICSAIAVIAFFFPEFEIAAPQKTAMLIFALITFVLSITVICQAVGKSNRYKAQEAQKLNEV